MNRRTFLAATPAMVVMSLKLTPSQARSNDGPPDAVWVATPEGYDDPPQDCAKRIYAISRPTDTGLQGGLTIRVREYADEAAAQRAMDREREHMPEQYAALRDASFIYSQEFPLQEDIQADAAEVFSFTSTSGAAAVSVHCLAGFIRHRNLFWELVAVSPEDGDEWTDADLVFDCARLFTEADPTRRPVSVDHDGFHTGGLWDLLPLPEDHPFIQRIISGEAPLICPSPGITA